ncbi:cytochrome c oxidase subunit II [Halococcus agarilyticus]|uniref:cytochrome c oxidase subunit II n=1 Tax=Halococcus agarilyticus TaxID=1232219 RepID=UPI00067784C3|nr:cytochrome c oxidase subunit II [Halococcus agarilyticus]
MKRTRLGLFGLLVVALLFAAVEPALAQSINERMITNLNQSLLYVAIPITILVEAILIYTVVKYRNNDDPQPTRENRRLEITWTITTAIILLFVGLASFVVLANPYISLVPDAAGQQPQAQQQVGADLLINQSGATAPTEGDAVEVEIIAYQWGWTFHYPEAGVNSSSTLAIPNGTDVYLHTTSTDVIHAVHVPELGLKQDSIPGQYNTIKTNATETGSYQLYCAEFCGSGHSGMLANMTVLPPEEYQTWLDEQESSGGNASAGGNASSNSSAIGAVSAKPA